MYNFYLATKYIYQFQFVFHQLSRINQELLDLKLSLEKKVKEYESQPGAGDARKLEKRLQAELEICVTELQGLVQVCTQREQGKDPNLSILLGARGTKCTNIFFVCLDCYYKLTVESFVLSEIYQKLLEL